MSVVGANVASCEEAAMRPDLDVCSMSGGGPRVEPCEEICVGTPLNLTCKSDDEVIHELRKAARISDSLFDVELQKEAHSVQVQIATGHGNDNFRKCYSNANDQSIQICEDDHPFAPEHDSTERKVVADVPLGHDILIGSDPKFQVQEIYEKLQQLVRSAEKVEEALELVHGTKIWQSSEKVHSSSSSSSSETEEVDSAVKDAEFPYFGTVEEDEAGSLFLNQQDQESAQQEAQQLAMFFVPQKRFSPPIRMMLSAYRRIIFKQITNRDEAEKV